MKITNYEIKETKNNLKVPVINGIHLHSIYNPIKEAQSFVEENKELLEKNSKFLVLGCGFGYHLNELAKALDEKYQGKYQIYAIEPIKQLIKDTQEINPLIGNIKVINHPEVEALYHEKELIHFLVNKPALLAHPASFNLSKEYFTSFLTFKSDNTVDKARYLVSNPILKNILSEFPHNITIDELVADQCASHKKIDSEINFIFHIYNELSKQTEAERGR